MTTDQMKILIEAAIVIVGLIVTYVIKPFIDANVNKTDQAKFLEYVKIAVRCANQLHTPEEWAQKKEEVVGKVNNYLSIHTEIVLTEEEIDTIIEGFVNEVKEAAKRAEAS